MKYIISIMIMVAAFSTISCTSNHHANEEETKFLVTSPLLKDTLITRNYVCQIRSKQHIELRALESGYLQNIYVDEGQFVKKGQLMFQIMPAVYEAELQKAQAEAKFDKANAEYTLAKTRLQFTQIRAPFDGIMDHFQVRLGSLVNDGDLLTTLSDNSELWVYFNVPEAEYLNYKTQVTEENLQKVNLMMANNQRFNYSGVVKTIEADFNNETGNIAFRATFPNPKGLLRHGETGNIEMPIPLKNVLLIPQKATFEILEKRYVFVVDKDNVVHSREINIEAEMPDLYIVKNGINANERILLEGIRKVKDNDKITFTYEKPESILPKLKVYVE